MQCGLQAEMITFILRSTPEGWVRHPLSTKLVLLRLIEKQSEVYTKPDRQQPYSSAAYWKAG